MAVANTCGSCCFECLVTSDTFAVDNLATDWDIRSGTATVSGGNLNLSAGANLVINNTPAPAGATGVYAGCVFRCTNTADLARLVILYEDDDNYWYCEAQPAATPTLKLFQRSAGTNTQKGSTVTITGFAINEDWAMELCYDGEKVNCAIIETDLFGTIVNGIVVAENPATAENTQAGVGGNETGQITFTSFTLQRHLVDSDTCTACLRKYPCSLCDTGYFPDMVQVETSGLTGCASVFNGTWLCEMFTTEFGGLWHGPCGASYYPISSTCDGGVSQDFRLDVEIITLGPVKRLVVTFHRIAFVTYYYELGVNHDCDGWNAFPVPRDPAAPGGPWPDTLITTIAIEEPL
jgi:hypothetical protein